ncbi:hypothetical protein EV361DRAFT_497074 [Lentinula raphanica]|uniref:Chromatin modification-related protein n=1 Tax=Lentinula raphanica TaxID=153919 RepID=A0AA38PHK1_9AGAR|nr:hypothetical protein F5880DRAFT_1615049 [Lentinula raphanica]KAJ3842770.1 hypothetical protein F5878DRAFT_555243 [Lentinula raphanica]KAJ3975445.1 hypothetical protein EV361DRAFT_497074 [Lentinula raphanica]
MSRKRRRSQAFPDLDENDNVEQTEERVELTEAEIEASRLEKEREIWDTIKEEHFEIIDQVPLTLHRQYRLMSELDQQTHGYLDDIVPLLQKYAAYRRNQDAGESPASTSAATAIPSTPIASSSNPPAPPFPKTPLRSVKVSQLASRPSTPLSLPAERMKPPETGKEILSHIAWLAEEVVSAAQEKVNLAQAAHDYISRQIQVLRQSIKEQETSIALGIRPGTQLAPILLPDVAPPSRWTKNTTGGLVLDDDDEPLEVNPTTLGIPADEPEPPTKRPARSRKGKRAAADQQTSLKITLPAMHDRLYCYCNKPSDGEMVACDNEECVNQWFHLTCTGLSRLPDESEKWYCDDCDPDKHPVYK